MRSLHWQELLYTSLSRPSSFQVKCQMESQMYMYLSIDPVWCNHPCSRMQHPQLILLDRAHKKHWQVAKLWTTNFSLKKILNLLKSLNGYLCNCFKHGHCCCVTNSLRHSEWRYSMWLLVGNDCDNTFLCTAHCALSSSGHNYQLLSFC